MTRAKRWSGWVVALGALLAFAPPASAQPGPWRGEAEREMMRQRAEERRPFELLLRNRDRLALTDGQVARLEEIARRLDAANAPLREELRVEGERFLRERRERMERLTPEQRRDTLQRIRAEGRPPLPPRIQELMGRMRGNIGHATRLAQDVLTPGQKQRARMLLREHRRREMRERGMGPGMRPHRPPQGPPGRP